MAEAIQMDSRPTQTVAQRIPNNGDLEDSSLMIGSEALIANCQLANLPISSQHRGSKRDPNLNSQQSIQSLCEEVGKKAKTT